MKKIFLGGIVLLSAISMSAFKVFDGKLVHLIKGKAGVKYNNFNVGGFAKGKFSGRNWDGNRV